MTLDLCPLDGARALLGQVTSRSGPAGRDRLPSGLRRAPAPCRSRSTLCDPDGRGRCDLAGAYALWRGGAARALMGGGPEHRPERYAVADPLPMGAAGPARAARSRRLRTATVSIQLDPPLLKARRGLSALGGACELVEIEGEAGVPPRAPGPPRRGVGGSRSASARRRRWPARRRCARPDPQPRARVGPGDLMRGPLERDREATRQ